MNEYMEILNRFLTPEQQTALVIITVSVMILTQAFKNIYFGLFPVSGRARKKAILWLAALMFGATGGVIGYLAGIPQQPLWFWIFCGVSSGGFAIGLFKLLIGIIWPKLQGMISKQNA